MTPPPGSCPVASPVALVTGASGSVGRATAIRLAQAGHALLLTGRDAQKLNATREAVLHDAAPMEQTDQAAITLAPVDLTAPTAPADLVTAAIARFGRLDVIAHVAGHAPLQPLEQNTPQQWRLTMDTNLSALVLLTAAAWPTFQKQRYGMVAAVSSMASFDPFPGFSMYAPAKAAVNMFIHCAAAEGAEYGIKAVAVAPGAIETPMLRGILDEKALPADKTLDPMDVAALLVDCIVGQRDFRSGETIQMPSP